MARPNNNSDKSRVLYTRDAWATLQWAMLAWCKDSIVSLTAVPGNGQFFIGDAPAKNAVGGRTTTNAQGTDDEDQDASEWFNLDFHIEEPLTKDSSGLNSKLQGDITTTDIKELGTYALITLEKASAWLSHEFGIVVSRMKVRQAAATTPGKTGRFRVWLHWTKAIAKSETYLALAIERLKSMCLSQDRRVRGPQMVQTRRPINAPYYQSFRFNGTHAMRIPPGRTAISAAEWLERYKARLAKRKKTDRVQKKRKRFIKVPKTKHGRPTRAVSQKLTTFQAKPKVGPRFSYAESFDTERVVSEFISSLA